jgi:hypothetical protein
MLPPHARPFVMPLYYIPNFLFFNQIFLPPFSLACAGGGKIIFLQKFILLVTANSLYNKKNGSDGAMGEGGNG